MAKRTRLRYLRDGDVLSIFLGGLRRWERDMSALSRADRAGGSYEDLVERSLWFRLQDLGIVAGSSVADKGVELSRNRAARLSEGGEGPQCRFLVDAQVRSHGGRGAINCIEIKALRRRKGRATELRRAKRDIAKLEMLSREPSFHRGYLLVVGLGDFAEDEFHDWMREVANTHRLEVDRLRLNHGGIGHVAVIRVKRRAPSARSDALTRCVEAISGVLGVPTARCHAVVRDTVVRQGAQFAWGAARAVRCSTPHPPGCDVVVLFVHLSVAPLLRAHDRQGIYRAAAARRFALLRNPRSRRHGTDP